MRQYLVRDIDPKLWARVRAAALAEGLPVRSVIIGLLRGYAEGRTKVRARLTETELRVTRGPRPA